MTDVEQINAYYKKLAEEKSQGIENSSEIQKLKALLQAGAISKVAYKKLVKKYTASAEYYMGKAQPGDSAYDIWYQPNPKQEEFYTGTNWAAEIGKKKAEETGHAAEVTAEEAAAKASKTYWDSVSKTANSSIADAQDKAIEDLIYEASPKPKIVSFSNPTSETYKFWKSAPDQKAAQDTWTYEQAQLKGNTTSEYGLDATLTNTPMDNEALTKTWNACTKGFNPTSPSTHPSTWFDETKLDEKTLENYKSKNWAAMPASKGATITFSPQYYTSMGDLKLKGISSSGAPQIHPVSPNKLKPAPTGELVWTYEQAHKVILKLQQDSRSFGYHLCLGGGVLNHGASGKDLDLYFLPLDNDKNIKTNPYTLLHHLRNCTRSTLEPFLNDPRYSDAHVPYIFKGKADWYGIGALAKRVDIFVIGNAEQLEQVNLYLLESATGGEAFELPQENLLHSAKEETYDDVL